MTDKEISPQQRKFKLKSLRSNEELPKNDKNLIYHPSRFVVAEKLQAITYNPKEVFQDFQNRIEEFETMKEVKTLQPSQQRITQPKEFKKRPLRRLENDFQMYKEIFVQPKAQALQQLKEKEKDFEVLFTKGQAKNYDKILNIHKEEEEKYGAKKDREKNLLGTMSIIKEEQQQLLKSSLNQQDNIDLKQEIDKLQNMDLNPSSEPTNQIFFDQQIQVQPPDLPNASIASPLTPGNGYAPSIPLTHNFKENKSSIKDLLVRAKAGMQAGDIQKEAHLSFYLGMVYETNKNYNEVKYINEFIYLLGTCAKLMEDKIGMALGTNRVAINFYNNNNFQKSIDYHKQNLQYSDQENTFAGMYNLGISNRKTKNYEEAIDYFLASLEWAQKREEAESQCLSYGQLGMTYFEVRQFELAQQSFTSCYELARRLKNTKLQLDCLLFITKISQYVSQEQQDQTIRILRDAVQCAQSLGEKKTATLCLCNLGILEGNQRIQQMENEFNDLEFEDF